MVGWVAPAISAVSSLASGLIGGGQKTPRYFPYYKAMLGPDVAKTTTGARMNALIAQQEFDGRMESAQKHGIHPLMMLGASTSSPSPVAVSSGGSGRDFSSIAQAGTDLSRAITGGQTKMERLQERLLETQITGQEIDNVMRASQVRTANQVGNPPESSSLAERLLDYKTNRTGYGDSVAGIHKIGMDESGNPIRVYNTDELGDNEVAQALHALRYTFPDYIHGNVTKPLARPLARFFRGFIDHANKTYGRR